MSNDARNANYFDAFALTTRIKNLVMTRQSRGRGIEQIKDWMTTTLRTVPRSDTARMGAH
jgi:hypothetical protein